MADDVDGLSRRKFLVGTAGALAAGAGCAADGAGASPAGQGSASETDAGGAADAGPDRDAVEPDGDAEMPDTAPRQVTSRVAISGAADVAEAVRAAVESAGGLSAIQPGQTVFIKPNAVHAIGVADSPGTVTSNAVLAAVIALVAERQPGKIVVGDRSARFFESADVLAGTGHQATAEAGGAVVYPAPRPSVEPDAWVLVQPPHYEEIWESTGGLLAMREIVEADHFIDVAVCKNHRYAGFTLSMKNLIGATGDDSRDLMHYTAGKPAELSRAIAILNGAFTPLLCIIDATWAIVNGGPEGIGLDAVRTRPGLILAGTDRVALDAAAVALLKQQLATVEVSQPDEVHEVLVSTPVFAFDQIVQGAALGIGTGVAAEIALDFMDVDATLAAAVEAVFREG